MKVSGPGSWRADDFACLLDLGDRLVDGRPHRRVQSRQGAMLSGRLDRGRKSEEKGHDREPQNHDRQQHLDQRVAPLRETGLVRCGPGRPPTARRPQRRRASQEHPEEHGLETGTPHRHGERLCGRRVRRLLGLRA